MSSFESLLTRDKFAGRSQHAPYALWHTDASPVLQPPEFAYSRWESGHGDIILGDVCVKDWNRRTPKSCHLPPGGGPLKVRITVEAVE